MRTKTNSQQFDTLREVEIHVENMKPIIGNPKTEKPVETSEQLHAMIRAYGRYYETSLACKERITVLMKRPSAHKWDQKKKAQMVRRLVEATTGVDQANDMIDQLKHRLSQNTHTGVI